MYISNFDYNRDYNKHMGQSQNTFIDLSKIPTITKIPPNFFRAQCEVQYLLFNRASRSAFIIK